jgi:hypothetical protein
MFFVLLNQSSMKVLAWDVGLRTLSYCLLDGTHNLDTGSVDMDIVDWGIIDVQDDDGDDTVSARTKSTTISVEEATRMMMTTLNRRAHLVDGVHAVVIEQQPAGGHNRNSNVRMKVMSHVIQSYYYARHLLLDSGPPIVTFVSPASKLTEMKNDVQPEAEQAQSKYIQNKKYAVRKTGQLLEVLVADGNSANVAASQVFLAGTKGKKDDLADAFLLGYYYVLKQVTPKKRRAPKKTDSEEPATAPPRKKRAPAKRGQPSR